MAFGELGPGTGTAADPYIIKDLASLDSMRVEPNAHYMMISDVDLGGGLWEPFTFTGLLNGRGYFIKNLKVDKSAGGSYAGLFTSLAGNGLVYDLNIETAPPTDVLSYVADYGGVLAGVLVDNARAVRICCRGRVDGGGDRVGGLIGYQAGNSSLEECVSLVEITGWDNLRSGCLVGWLTSDAAVRSAVWSSELSGFTRKTGSAASVATNTSELTIAELADSTQYPPYFDFAGGSWEIDENGLPRVKARPTPIIEVVGDPAPGTGLIAHIAGTVDIDGTAAERQVIVISDDPNGRQVLGEGMSLPDGTFDIEYNDWGGAVIALALDNYGGDWAASTAINSGTIIHPGTPNGYVYEATSSGTTGESEPTWNTGGAVTDGSVTWNPRPFYRPIASGPIQGEVIDDGSGAGVSARYWRVHVYANGGGARTEIAEMRLLDATDSDLIGTGTPSAESGGASTSNAFDSDDTTRWITAFGIDVPTWLAYDFGEDVTPATLELVCHDLLDRAPTDFALEYSTNGTDWNELERYTVAFTQSYQTEVFSLPTGGSPAPTGYDTILIEVTAIQGTNQYVGNLQSISLLEGGADIVIASVRVPSETGGFEGEHLIDGDDSTEWLCSGNQTLPYEIELTLSALKDPTDLVIEGSVLAARNIKSFKILGSADAGQYELIKEFTDLASWSGGETKTFSLI